MKNVKNVFFMFLCLVMCTTFLSINAEASSNRDGEIVDGTLLTSDTSAMGKWEAMARGTYLQSGSCSISADNGIVYLYGVTTCNRICDRVDIDIYLERLVGGSWVSVTQRHAIAYNSASAAYSTSISVSRGYYYRLRGGHFAAKSGVQESNTSYTNGIYVK